MVPSWLYTLSPASLAFRSASSPLSRPFSPGPIAKARTPPPRPPQLLLPHPLHLLVRRVSRERSPPKASQPTFHTPSPCRGPPTWRRAQFSPTSSRLKVHLRRLYFSPFSHLHGGIYVLLSNDITAQPTHRVCCMIIVLLICTLYM